MKDTVVIGLLGTTLDQGQGPARWERWRPTVGVCSQEDLLVRRFDLICNQKFAKLYDVVAEDIRHASPETEIRAHMVDLDNPWDFEEVYSRLHDFCRGYAFDPDKEDYLVHITTGSHVAQICLFLLTESRHFPARLIQTRPSGAKKADPAGEYAIIDLDLSKYDRIAMRFKQEISDDISFLKSGIETRNPEFNALIEEIERVAVNSIEPILLTGPTGAGKSNLARRIFSLKQCRRELKGPFVEVNCATLRGDAAMSALFGHKKGAFTGALDDRLGLLRKADQGLLFLDEIGELGSDEQSMLLRAVEEKQFLPMGSDQEARSEFQLICGTNRDLMSAVRQGKFREDLLSRINLWTFELPGLRHRPEDIEPNLTYELDRFCERNNTRVTFNKEALKTYLKFAVSPTALWTANFRDLNASVIRMSTLAPGGRISRDVVNQEITRLKHAWRQHPDNAPGSILTEVLGAEKVEQLDRYDQGQLADVITICRQSKNLSEAGRKLFGVSRKNKTKINDADRLKKYLARFEISWDAVKQ